MDSLTQIALGAAVGEVVLGKKVGNRAMVWGAIGGTIPDLDVLSNLITDEITALAFHRGISHSIFFAVVSAPVFGWLVHRLYESELYQSRTYKGIISSLVLLFILSWNFIPIVITGSISRTFLLITLFVISLLAWRLYRNYFRPELHRVSATWRDWSWLFFWAVFTHPLLDCCTAYGTQLFQPFSDFRVALNNISVVDPIYTIPLLLGVIIASRMLPISISRKWTNGIGITLSSMYLAFSAYNKLKVDRIFEASLKEQGIEYSRFMTAPTIMNNILWNGVAEGKDEFYHGMYSLFDESPEVKIFNRWPKNHDLVATHMEERDMQILLWFSKGYYNILENEKGQLQLNDLRFGAFGNNADRPSDYVFKFILEEKNGKLVPRQSREVEQREDMFSTLWARIKGIED